MFYSFFTWSDYTSRDMSDIPTSFPGLTLELGNEGEDIPESRAPF